MNDNWLQLSTTILGYIFGAGGWLTWFFERRKNKASADIASADALKSLRDLYLQVIGDASESLKKVPELEKLVKEQGEEIRMLTEIISKQREACEKCAIITNNKNRRS